MDYFSGVGVAAMMVLWGCGTMLIKVNSLMNRNFKKIGLRLNWVLQGVGSWTAEDAKRNVWRSIGKFAFIFAFDMLFIVASWLYVAYYLGTVVWRWSKDRDAPQSIKEYRWKMRNVDMSFVEVVREMWKLNESTVPFEEFLAVTADEVREKAYRAPCPIEAKNIGQQLGLVDQPRKTMHADVVLDVRHALPEKIGHRRWRSLVADLLVVRL